MDLASGKTVRRRFLAIVAAGLMAAGAAALTLAGCGGSSGDGGGCSGSDRFVSVNTYDGTGRFIGEFNFTQQNASNVCSGGSYTTLSIRNRSGFPLCVAYRVEFFDSSGSRRWSYEGNVNYLNNNSSSYQGTVSTNSYPIDSGTLRVTFLSDPFDACGGNNNPMVGSWQGTGRTSGSFNPSIPSSNANIYMNVANDGVTNIEVRFVNSSGFENGQIERYSGSTDTGAYFDGSGNAPWGSFSSSGFFEDKGSGRRGVFLSNYYFGGSHADETISGTITLIGKSALVSKVAEMRKPSGGSNTPLFHGGGSSK